MIWRMNLTSNMSWSALCWVRGRQLLSFFLLLDTTSSKDFITSSVTLDTSWCNVPLKDNCNIATSKILLNMVNQMNLVNSYLQGEEQNPDFFLIVLLQQYMLIFLFTWISLFTFDLHVKKLKIVSLVHLCTAWPPTRLISRHRLYSRFWTYHEAWNQPSNIITMPIKLSNIHKLELTRMSKHDYLHWHPDFGADLFPIFCFFLYADFVPSLW